MGNSTEKSRFVLENLKFTSFWGAFAQMLWGKFSNTVCVKIEPCNYHWS